METFTPKRSLLNPKFEGYRFDPITQEDVVIRYDLEYKPTQATTSAGSPLSFQEVQSRITHNHLSVAREGGRALYVDAQYNVIVIEVNLKTLLPSFSVVYELPKPIQSTSFESPHLEYPSAAFLSPTVAFVSDGHGSMYILHLTDTGSSRLLGVFTLPTVTKNFPPFRIHNVANVSPTTAVALLSSRHYEEMGHEAIPPSKGRTKSSPAEFDIWAAKFDMEVLGSSTDIEQMDILWCRRGKDVPIFISYHESWKSYMLVGGSVYREADAQAPPLYEPTSDEFAPIPRQNENLDTLERVPQKPPPYSWTQTSDSVTVAFPLPSVTVKSDIKVVFSPRTLTLHIHGESVTSIPFPHYSAKMLWDGISPTSSFWTWDREAEHSFGLLTLHLDKQHEGTKWMQVFASQASTTTQSTSEDIEVAETLDASELWHVREALEKYTTAVREGDDASGLGLGRGVPSLAEGELDDEVDSSVGRTSYLTWVSGDGSIPSFSTQTQEVPFTLLSTALPGGSLEEVSLIIKNNLDGLVFSFNPTTGPGSAAEWNHTATFPALAFVLASKQDTRFTHHIGSKAVLAFENGVRDRGGNLYVYRAVATSERWAKQTVLKVGAGQAGCLLGVGGLRTVEGMTVVLCLTDGELILIKNLL